MADTRFKDFNQLFEDWIELPIDGTVWRIPGPDALTGLRATALMELGGKVFRGEGLTDEDVRASQLDDAGEEALYRRLLGERRDPKTDDVTDPGLFPAMIAAGVSLRALRHVGQTVLVWVGLDFNLDAAIVHWNAAGDTEKMLEAGKALAPNRQARRSTKTTGAASTTKRAVSTTGTKRPRTPGKR